MRTRPGAIMTTASADSTTRAGATKFSVRPLNRLTMPIAAAGASAKNHTKVRASGSSGARFPYLEEQAAGAWLCLGLLALWGWRRHARRQWRSPAALGFMACAAALFGFWILLGMQAWVVGLILVLYLLLLIGGMRIRAQIGAQWILMPLVWNPNSLVVNVWGPREFTASTLALLS